MYEVKIFHYHPYTRRGDLEEQYSLESSFIYRTRKSAKECIENILNKKDQKMVKREYHRGNETSFCYYFTGHKWQNENSGSSCEEYYEYQLSKVIPK